MSDRHPSRDRVRAYVTPYPLADKLLGRPAAFARLQTAMPKDGFTILKTEEDHKNEQLRIVLLHPGFPEFDPADPSKSIVFVKEEAPGVALPSSMTEKCVQVRDMWGEMPEANQ